MKPIVITDENFVDVVLNSTKPVLLYFWHHECPPCKTVSPKVDQLADHFGERVAICKSNIREWEAPFKHYNLFGVPRILFIKNGEIQSQIHGGEHPLERIKLLVEEFITTPAEAISEAAQAAKAEFDAALEAAQAEYSKVEAAAYAEFETASARVPDGSEAAKKPILDELSRRMEDTAEAHKRGELSQDNMFRISNETLMTIIAEDEYKDAAEAWKNAATEWSVAVEPFSKTLQEKSHAAEAVYNQAVVDAKAKYDAALAA